MNVLRCVMWLSFYILVFYLMIIAVMLVSSEKGNAVQSYLQKEQSIDRAVHRALTNHERSANDADS